MRLLVERLGDGPGPSEVVVQVTTAQDILEQLVIHSTALMDDTIDIGFPIYQEKDNLLVELPRETVTGRWRVWVPKGSVLASDFDRP